MKPAPFRYARPATAAEAVALLASGAGDAKLLAGGQSLVPILNLRLAEPKALIDLNRLTEISGVRLDAGSLRIGAMTRHREVESSPEAHSAEPLLARAAKEIGHLAIRNRGTIGGSLSHADPAAELPMMGMLLDAELKIVAAKGARTIAARDFFRDTLSVDLVEDEIVTEIAVPKLPAGTGWGFEEVSRRSGDFALAAVAVTLALADGAIVQARIATTGVAPTARRVPDAEAMLAGATLENGVGDAIIDAVRAATEPPTDLHASSDYRRHLVGVLAGRALAAAWRRATAAA